MITAAVSVSAVLLDRWWGEPRSFHPLVGFGRLATWLERRLYGPVDAPACLCVPARRQARRLRGAVAVLMLVTPVALLAVAIPEGPVGIALEILVLYLALGHASLGRHARAVARALESRDLLRARRRVGRMVSRETATLDETGAAKAAVESVLENGSDAVLATLFWFLVAGAPGVIVHRLVNTLDAMWGYRNTRYRDFGWAAARLDDALNWVPARLTALTYVLLGDTRMAWRCWRRQGSRWKSPNAGPVMAAGAGALGLRLGGAARYHGKVKARPILGAGKPPVAADIDRACRLVQRALAAWLVLIFVAAGGGYFV